MAEYIKIKYIKGKGIRIKADMTKKHIDDAIRDLVKMRKYLDEEECRQREAVVPQVITKPRSVVPANKPRRCVAVGEAIVFAVVGSQNADLKGNI